MVAVVRDIKFTEARLEQAIIELLGEQGYPHVLGQDVARNEPSQVLILDDLRRYLSKQYQQDGITPSEIESIIRQLQSLPASDLYRSNKTFCHWLANGFLFKREDRNQKDLYIELIDTQQLNAALAQLFNVSETLADEADLQQVADPVPPYFLSPSNVSSDSNVYKLVNQLEIEGVDGQMRIPDGILYVNGLPLV
ncbi:type I restriction endonuclease, partial [Marinomonas arenicola]